MCRSSSSNSRSLVPRTRKIASRPRSSEHKVFSALKSSREIFLIDAMHLVDARPGKLDWPAHAEIVLQNPAEFDVSDRTRFAAAAQFLDENQNYRAAGGLAMQGAANAKKREPPGLKGVLPDPRDEARQAER